MKSSSSTRTILKTNGVNIGSPQPKRAASGWFWAALILTVVVFSVLVKLGLWQWDRGLEKQNIERMLEEREQQQVVELSSLVIPNASQQNEADYLRWLGMPIVAKLRPQPILFFLDNQTVDGKVGYLVYQLMHSELGRSVLFEIGFTPVIGGREVLPAVNPVTQPMSVTGRLYQKQRNPLGNKLYLEAFEPSHIDGLGTVQTYRVQHLNLTAIYDVVEQPVLSWVIQPTDGSTDYVHPWKPISMNANKHFGYSLQWFSMAAVFASIMIFVAFKVFKSSRKEAP
ncbi:SURF1 family protein [Vibrio sp. 10N.261.51.F12]|uniref:SURF1 family protein n=1 Tax=Vibrio sp. 10N.261.51.F12 TaxID=3229679 RepID=UPI00354D1018